jgi:hypothetical protein
MTANPVDALARRHAVAVVAAAVPSSPGLYAVHGAPDVWEQLGLGTPPDERPLYVGKSESSLAGRDDKSHFRTGKTGSSTLRRTVGSLLADTLELVAVPRNLAKPGHFANFAFAPVGDEGLTNWMLANLLLAVWPRVAGVDLVEAERAVLNSWLPPLNARDVVTPWLPPVKAARKRMAAQARTHA